MRVSLGMILLLFGLIFTTHAQIPVEPQPFCFDDPSCENMFPEGGQCSAFPISPFCSVLQIDQVCGKTCACCRNCHDQGCSNHGHGWHCSTHPRSRQCVANEHLCRNLPKTDRKCYCCPPDPMCWDNGCEELGPDYSCMKKKDITDEKCIQTKKKVCSSSNPDEPCYCCKKPEPEPLCWDKGCEELGPDYSCMKKKDTDEKCRKGKCYSSNPDEPCYCCKKPPQPCHNKTCSYDGIKGQCVGPKDTPPRDYVRTDTLCGRGELGDCTCWVPDKCWDKGCDDLHGWCVPEGVDLPNYRPSNHWCKSPPDKKCNCWTPFCESQECAKMRGICLLPWDPVPKGSTMVKIRNRPFFCNRALKCACWRVPKILPVG